MAAADVEDPETSASSHGGANGRHLSETVHTEEQSGYGSTTGYNYGVLKDEEDP